MNLDHLSVFALVAEHGSLSKAANALEVAQSVISRKLALLEDEWGDRLFHRTGRGVVLTEFGQRVLPFAQTLLEDAERLQGEVVDSSGVPSGTVHIGMVPSMAMGLASVLYEEISRVAPQVHLRITDAFTTQLDAMLAGGQLQIAVVSRYGPLQPMEEESLGQVDSCLIGKTGLPHLAGPVARFADLDGLPLVLSPSILGQRSVLETQAKLQGVRLNIAVEVDSLESIRSLCSTGKVYTILQHGSVRRDVMDGLLQAVPLAEPRITRTVAMCVAKGAPLTRASRLVMAKLRELVPPSLSSHDAG